MSPNFAISDGLPFARIEEQLIVERLITSARKSLVGMAMMTVLMCGVSVC